MPRYEYYCPTCHITVEEQRRVADRDSDPPGCQKCGQPMNRNTATAPQGNFPGADSWRHK